MWNVRISLHLCHFTITMNYLDFITHYFSVSLRVMPVVCCLQMNRCALSERVKKPKKPWSYPVMYLFVFWDCVFLTLSQNEIKFNWMFRYVPKILLFLFLTCFEQVSVIMQHIGIVKLLFSDLARKNILSTRNCFGKANSIWLY